MTILPGVYRSQNVESWKEKPWGIQYIPQFPKTVMSMAGEGDSERHMLQLD